MASDAATFITASTRAASASDTRFRRMADDAVSFHIAHGSAAFHRCAIFVCSGVRVRATCRTSSIAAWNSADAYAGGAAGRNCEVESSSHVRAFCKEIPRGGMPLALYHIPGPVGIVPLHGVTKLTVGAHAITRWATSSPSFLPAFAGPAAPDPLRVRSMSRASSRAIDARTAESLNSSDNTAAEALAMATSEETARLPVAEFTAPYWARLMIV